jgi:hypothetical protein
MVMPWWSAVRLAEVAKPVDTYASPAPNSSAPAVRHAAAAARTFAEPFLGAESSANLMPSRRRRKTLSTMAMVEDRLVSRRD